MAKLIFSMMCSLDGFIEDAGGRFAWAVPDDEVHAFVNQRARSVRIHLYGRRMYETMSYWETHHRSPDESAVAHEWATQWRDAEKVVFSRSLQRTSTARTRIESDFDVSAVRRLKATARGDLSIGGPGLAATAIQAGLVDEVHAYVFPVVVGAGKRMFQVSARHDLALVEQRGFDSGVVFLRYLPARQDTASVA